MSATTTTPGVVPSSAEPPDGDGAQPTGLTTWGLIEVVRRQWLVALVGLALTLGGTFAITQRTGVYFSQVHVTLVGPRGVANPNPLQYGGSDSLVAVAGLVARQMGETGGALAFSPSATIVDMGVRNGVWVRLPNAGTQWTPSFPRAELDVQVVGDDPDEVDQRLHDTLTRIETVLRKGQEELGAAPGTFVGTAITPQNPAVLYKAGSRSRATAAALSLGLALTLTATVLTDRWRLALASRRRRGSRPS